MALYFYLARANDNSTVSGVIEADSITKTEDYCIVRDSIIKYCEEQSNDIRVWHVENLNKI